MKGNKRADALAERLTRGDEHTEGLINRLDTFLSNMEVISDRLIARLDRLDEQDGGR